MRGTKKQGPLVHTITSNTSDTEPTHFGPQVPKICNTKQMLSMLVTLKNIYMCYNKSVCLKCVTLCFS
jgi:hypothetical protein